MLKKQLMIFCFLLCAYQSSCLFNDILDIGKKLWKMTKKFTEVKSAYDAGEGTLTILSILDDDNAETLAKIKELSDKLDGMQSFMARRFETLEFMLKQQPGEISINDYKKDLVEAIEKINKRHTKVLWAIGEKNMSASVRIEKYREAIQTVEMSIEKIETLLIPSEKTKSLAEGLIIDFAHQVVGLGHRICKEKEFFHHFVVNLLQLVLITEMTALKVFTLTYPTCYPEDWNLHIALAQKKSAENYLTYLKKGWEAMDMTPNNLWACDPEDGVWVRGETYFEIEKLQERLVDHELTKREPEPVLADQTLCHGGRLTDCFKSRNRSVLEYPYQTTPPKFTCHCNRDFENAISLVPITTATAENMVVTGVRLVRKNKTLYIQLRQGQLDAHGQIKPHTQSWIPLPETNNHTKKYITNKQKRFLFSRDILPVGYALTGVEFIDKGEFFTVGITGHKYDRLNGTLLEETVEESMGRTSRLFPDAIRHFKRVNSIYSKAFHTPTSAPGDWMELHYSNSGPDTGKSMLPLFDSQPVVTNPPSPLGGIGLYHKVAEGYAGFIGIRIYSLPYRWELFNMIRDNQTWLYSDEN